MLNVAKITSVILIVGVYPQVTVPPIHHTSNEAFHDQLKIVRAYQLFHD